MTDATEFGGLGRVGPIQPAATGHVIGKNAADNRGVKEAAILALSEGVRLAGVDPDLPKTDLHYDSMMEVYNDFQTRWGGRRVEE